MNLSALAEADISNKGEKFASRFGKETLKTASRGSIDSQDGSKVARYAALG